MGRFLTYRAVILLLIAFAAPRPTAAESPSLTYSLPSHIPTEAADLLGDLMAMDLDEACSARPATLARLQDTPGWVSHVTRHFVLLTDAQPGWSVEAGQTLEATRFAFYQAFRGAGFAPGVLDDRMVWVAFSRREDFQQYARTIDRLDMSWSDGYYSTRTNRVALVCDEGRSAGTGGTETDSTETHPQAAEGFKHLAQATHEAVHQLAFNSGLQKRGVMYPLWASEGLATNFEAEGPGPFGPGHDNPYRRRQLARAVERDGLRNTYDFVAMTKVPVHSSDDTHDVYAQSWAFFRFLFQHRPQELRSYLSELASLEPGRRDTATLRREFVRAFGRLDSLDRSWQAYVRLLIHPESEPSDP